MPAGRPRKRSDQTHGHRSYAEKEGIDKPSVTGDVAIPETPEQWHPTAKMWLDALKNSAQSQYYEESDWAQAFVCASLLDEMMRERPLVVEGRVIRNEATGRPYMVRKITGQTLSAMFSGMNGLGVTEGDRRRMKIEVQRTKPQENDGDADVLSFSVV